MEIAGLPLRRVRERLAEGIDGPLARDRARAHRDRPGGALLGELENAARVLAQLGNLAVALTAMWLVAQVPPQTLRASRCRPT